MEEARKEICEMQDLSPGLIEKVPVNMIEGFQEDAALHIPSSIEAEKLPAQEKNVRRIKMWSGNCCEDEFAFQQAE